MVSSNRVCGSRRRKPSAAMKLASLVVSGLLAASLLLGAVAPQPAQAQTDATQETPADKSEPTAAHSENQNSTPPVLFVLLACVFLLLLLGVPRLVAGG